MPSPHYVISLGRGYNCSSGVARTIEIMLATNMSVNTRPKANAQVRENFGMYNALTRNPIMLITRKLVFNGAVRAMGVLFTVEFIYFSGRTVC